MLLYILPFLISTTLQINEHAVVREPIAYHDPWFSQDKFLHFSVSAGITGFSYYMQARTFDMELSTAKTLSVSLAALIGIGKEVFDNKTKGQFSWKDLFWDGTGIAVGYFLFCH